MMWQDCVGFWCDEGDFEACLKFGNDTREQHMSVGAEATGIGFAIPNSLPWFPRRP